MAPIVGMDDLAEVTLSGVQEVLTWETEADYATAVDSPGMVADDLGDHAGGAVAADGYHYGSLTRGLVAYYSLDEGSGTTAGDATELGNDGTINGATWVGSGKVGSDCLSFDGTDDNVGVGANLPGPLDEYTATAWVYMNGTTEGKYHNFRVNNGIDIRFDSASGAPQYFHKDGAGSFVNIIGNALSTGIWQHLALVYDGTDMYMFQDGTQTASNSLANPGHTAHGDTGQARLGSNDDATGGFLNGRLDDVRFYDRALSTPEIQALSNRTATSPVPTEATL